MRITYANKRVEKFFTDYSKMQKKLPFEWVRSIKKLMNQLTAADNWLIILCGMAVVTIENNIFPACDG